MNLQMIKKWIPCFIIYLISISLLSISLKYLGHVLISSPRSIKKANRTVVAIEQTVELTSLDLIDFLIIGMFVTQLVYASTILHNYQSIIEHKIENQTTLYRTLSNDEQIKELRKIKNDIVREDIGVLLRRLNRLMSNVEIILLTSSWNDIKSQHIGGMIEWNEYQRYCQKLRKRILAVIDQLLHSYIHADPVDW